MKNSRQYSICIDVLLDSSNYGLPDMGVSIPSTGPQLRDGLLIRNVDDELLIVDPDSALVHQLNDTASLIWRLWENGESVDRIVEALTSRFAVSTDRAERDVLETIAQFRVQALIA